MLVVSRYCLRAWCTWQDVLVRPGGRDRNSGRMKSLAMSLVPRGCQRCQPIIQTSTYPLHHFVQWFQDLEHARDILIGKVVLGSFLQAVVPHLVPQDRGSNELRTDHFRLIDNHVRMLPHLGHDVERHSLSSIDIRLCGDSEGINESLRMRFSYIVEQSDDERLDSSAGSLHTGNDLSSA